VPVFETLAPEDLQRVVEVAVPRSFPGHHVKPVPSRRTLR